MFVLVFVSITIRGGSKIVVLLFVSKSGQPMLSSKSLGKKRLPFDTAIPLWGKRHYKIMIQNDTCTPMFIATLFTIVSSWKQHRW